MQLVIGLMTKVTYLLVMMMPHVGYPYQQISQVEWAYMVPSVFSLLGLVGQLVAQNSWAPLVVVYLSLCQLLCEWF